MLAILLHMRKVRVNILLREDLLLGFRSRGLTNLSGAVEEFLEIFLSALPPERKKRSSKETRELVRKFIESRPARDTPITLQELITLLQNLQTLLQQIQSSQLQPQPNSTTQEAKH
jgi:hypothetical protein